MFNAGNPRHVKARQREEKAIESDDSTILGTIMEHYDGRRWIYAKLVRGHIFSTPFSTDPIQMAFNCGIQTEALQDFVKIVTLCPEEYLQMMKEANERHESEHARTSRDSSLDARRREGDRAEAERIGLVSERARGSVEDEDDGDEAGRGGL